MVSRRASIAALGAAATGAVLRPALSADLPPLRCGIVPISGTAPYYAAMKFGYFAAEGVAMSSEIIRGGAAAIPALVGGSLDIVYSNGTSVVQAIARGIDLRMVVLGTIMTSAPPDPAALLKRKGDPFRTGRDLEGKVVAANAVRDVQWMFIKAWVAATGGDPDKVQIIEVAVTSMVAAIKEKRVDAALVIDPYMTVAFDDPEIELLDWPMSKVFPGGPVAFFIVSGDTAQRRPKDIRAFFRAYKRGAAWVNANEGKEPYFNLVAEYSGMNIDLVRRMKTVPAASDVIPSTLPRLTNLMRQTGLLDTNVDLRAKIFT
jgi:NitT/TauT family transport system substrate-binding protein